MPNFPNYTANVPASLHPLNPKHYLLLAYWVFFRPSHLTGYLYQGNPEVYQMGSGRGLLRSWGVRAHRHLYLMGVVCTIISLLLASSLLFFYNLGTTQGHTASLNVVAVTPDGRYTISASAGGLRNAGTLKVWDIDRLALANTLAGQKNAIFSAVVTPDGKRVVSGAGDSTVFVWDLQRGQKLYRLEGHGRWVNAVAVTPDGKRAISASADTTLKVWDIEAGKKLRTLEGHTREVNGVVAVSDTVVISGSDDGVVKVWDVNTGAVLHSLTGHKAAVKKVVGIPGGNRVISPSADGTLKVWDWQRGALVFTLSGHEDGINDVAVTADGQTAVSASADGTLKVWDLTGGGLRQTLTGHQGWVNAVAVTGDGKFAVSGSSDHTVKVWDLATGAELHSLKGHTDWVRSVAVTPDGKFAVSGAGDRFPRMWDITSGKEVPLKTARNTLAVAVVGFNFLSVACLLILILVAAVVFAVGVMAFGVPGAALAVVVLALIGSVVFGWAFITADMVAVNPAFTQQYGAVTIKPLVAVGAFAVAMGMCFNLAFAVAGRRASAALMGVVFMVVIAFTVGILEATILNSSESIARLRFLSGLRVARNFIPVIATVALAETRLLFYPFHFIAALISNFIGKKHPISWDEMIFVPLPGTVHYLHRQLQQDETTGMNLLAQVAANPFQRRAAILALHRYIHQAPSPLHTLYRILASPVMAEYISPPISQQDWQILPSIKQVLFLQLDRRSVNTSSDWIEQFAQNLVEFLTWALFFFPRYPKQTPLTAFASFLAVGTTPHPEVPPSPRPPVSLSSYPGGEEIDRSFAVMATFLSYQELAQITSQIPNMTANIGDNPIRPLVIKALEQLSAVSAEISAYETASEPTAKVLALGRATRMLEETNTNIVPEIMEPEKQIIQQIIENWRSSIGRGFVI
ncbi:WD40 repeat domain-containing protein [[Phormidium] sp. ETS-05]|uniref:WD40 repeat domain-containing protein n=1 Tax=[Phormidium] sp. ETS-05 TaxID=222819 RepID=UPI0018EF0B56|nr:WD40 repeat domain-containing protein [[Phormidium] sp. ETS-05]